MFRKIASGIILTTLLISTLTLTFNIQSVRADPTTWIVDDDGPADFNTIQEAVDAASSQDTICVRSGFYSETVNIDKDGLIIIGEDRVSNGILGGFEIYGDGNLISDFTIQGSGLDGTSGVYFEGASYNTLKNNIIADWYWGIYLQYHAPPDPESCRNNVIVGNDIIDNHCGVFFFEGLTDNKFYHNNFYDNDYNVDYVIPFNEIWDDGYPSGGNYWGAFLFDDFYSGPNQDQPGSDGIGDTPYLVAPAFPWEEQSVDNIDHYPLMRPWTDKRLAINHGAAWLAAQQDMLESGAWNVFFPPEDWLHVPPEEWPPLWHVLYGDYYPVASTAFAVVALCEYARRPPPFGFDMDPFDDTYIYKDKIISGLEYIFLRARMCDINIEPAGDPDVTLPNGRGTYFLSPEYGRFYPEWPGRTALRPVYETSIVMMALEATCHPEFVVDSEQPAVDGWTYLDVMKDAVDYLAWAQNDDPNPGRGGWNIGAYDDGTAVGPWSHTVDPSPGIWDTSRHLVSQWTALGLMSAEAWGIDAPTWVKTELLNWLSYTQDFPGTGGFEETDTDLMSIAVTAAGLIELTYCDVQTADPRWDAARSFIGDDPEWYSDYDWITGVGHMGDYYGMYAVMKAAMTADEDPVTPGVQPIRTFGVHDWQEEYDPWLLAHQQHFAWTDWGSAYGRWYIGEWKDSFGVLATEWALLVLLKHYPPYVGTATGTGTATFDTDTGNIEDLEAVDEASLPIEGKPPIEFPHGFFSFRVTGLTPGQTVTITGTFPSNMPVGTQYWKCQDSTWVQIPIGDDDGDNVITFMVTDGGLGDADETANGEFVDPGGPGTIARAATIDIDPDTLNLMHACKHEGQWITAYIELPEGCNVEDIDSSTVSLNDTIWVDLEAPTQIGDYDSDGIDDLVVKFDRAEALEWLRTADYSEDTGKSVEATLTVTGEVAGETFEGSDTVRVLLTG